MVSFDNSEVVSLRPRPYSGRKARETVRRLQTPDGIIVERSLRDAFEQQGFALSEERDNKSVYDPQIQFSLLARYRRKIRLRLDETAFHLACQMTMKAFGANGKKLKPLTSREDVRRTIDGSKSSGAPFFDRKEAVFDDDYDLMVRILDGDKVPPPCVAYYRVQHGAEGPKQRLVWGYPQSMTLLESRFARPLIDEFKFSRNPMVLGLRRHEIAARMVRIENQPRRLSMDYSRFDASIHPRLIDFAFGVLKEWFEPSGEWDRIINYFIHTPILMPDGLVYRKGAGVPSGSYFTQLIDSIINYLSIQYLSIRLLGGPAQADQILVLGDDSAFGFDGSLSVRRVSQVMSELGLIVSDSKSEVTRFGEPLSFLGHEWFKTVVDRPAIETVKRMVFPERLSDIPDARLRMAVRVSAYLSDSTSAWKLLTRWDRWKGNRVLPNVARHSTLPPVSGHLDRMMKEAPVSGTYGGLMNGYAGILL